MKVKQNEKGTFILIRHELIEKILEFFDRENLDYEPTEEEEEIFQEQLKLQEQYLEKEGVEEELFAYARVNMLIDYFERRYDSELTEEESELKKFLLDLN